MPPVAARAHARLSVHRSPRLVDGRWTTRVTHLDGRIFVPPVVSRRDQIALVGHELLHVYRLLNGSRSESPGGRGERLALLLERQILDEIRSSNSATLAVFNIVDLRRFSSDLDYLPPATDRRVARNHDFELSGRTPIRSSPDIPAAPSRTSLRHCAPTPTRSRSSRRAPSARSPDATRSSRNPG